MTDVLTRWKALSPRVTKLLGEIPKDIGVFWDDKRFCFSRSTAELNLTQAYFPTATYRCVQALATIGTSEQKPYLKSFAANLSENPALALESGLDKNNVFTESHLIQALALVPDALSDADRTQHVDNLVTHLKAHHGAAFSDEPTHAFLTYHALVALLGARSGMREDPSLQSTWKGLEDRLYRLIAIQESGATVQSDVVELAFCLCALSLRKPLEAALLHKAIRVVCEHQGSDGAWPSGRPLRYSGHHSVHVPSIEIALALARLADGLGTDTPERLLDALYNVAELLVNSRRTVVVSGRSGTYRGWGNDRARREDLVESWVNALAGSFLHDLARAATDYASRTILERYGRELPEEISPTWAQIEETDTERPIKEFLSSRIIDPIKANEGRPQKDSCSLILFGPPGTSKTTLARGMAKELEWPLMTLTPGAFVERGLEYIETRAREVFDDLFRVERAIVLFDECDELFLRRPDKPTDASTRTIASLVTATMLPRLQRLHDLHLCVLVLATNLFESLDDAIRRPGRFDYRISVGPPDEKARRAILERELAAPFTPKLEFLALRTDRFTYTELKRLSRDLNTKAKSSSDPRILDAFAIKLIDAASSGLSISDSRHKHFLKNEQTMSDHRLFVV
jgi:hypothetical protein